MQSKDYRWTLKALITKQVVSVLDLIPRAECPPSEAPDLQPVLGVQNDRIYNTRHFRAKIAGEFHKEGYREIS